MPFGGPFWNPLRVSTVLVIQIYAGWRGTCADQDEHSRWSADHQPSTESTAHHSTITLDRLVLLLLLQQLLQLLLHTSDSSRLISLLLKSIWFGVVGQTESPRLDISIVPGL